MAISAKAITILDVLDSGSCCINGPVGLRAANLLSAIAVYSIGFLPFAGFIKESVLIHPC